MARWACRRLTEPIAACASRPFHLGLLAIAGVVALAACSHPADAVPAAAPAAASTVPATSATAATSTAPAAASAPPALSGAPGAGASPPAVRTVSEAPCATAPLSVRVVAVRQESADSIRVELALANLAAADAFTPGSPVAASVTAAVDALDGMSLLSADGRRRLFALRASAGNRVGTPAQAPPPGGTRTFWALFPAAEGPVSVLLPGFAPLSGLPVAPHAASSEP